MSVLNELRKPNCDVCEWATSSWWAYEMNLCQPDFEMVCKVAKQERERIIRLLEGNHLTAASELIEQDALSRGENK
jgi:hypothetical protein